MHQQAKHKYNYNERSGVFIGDSGLWHLPSHCMILSSQPTSFVEDCPVVSFVFVISYFCICMLTNKYKKCKPQLPLQHYYFSHFKYLYCNLNLQVLLLEIWTRACIDRIDPEWLACHWCWAEWKSKQGAAHRVYITLLWPFQLLEYHMGEEGG